MLNLNRRADELEALGDSRVAESEESVAAAEALWRQASEIRRENDRRLREARDRLSHHPEEVRDSAWLNAGQTYPLLTLSDCELWECAADSAQFLRDSQGD